ncbi:MAG: hypothetical protein NVS3B21_32530 [Acidimicrobiales bacterium]
MNASRPGCRFAAIALALAAATSFLPVAANANPSTGPTIGLAAGFAGQTSLEKQHFAYATSPGAVIRDSVTVFNLTSAPVPIDLFAVDMVTTPDGQHAPGPRTPAPTDAGSWIRLGSNHVDLAPHQVLNVPFRVTIPRHATPGDHLGAVVASYLGPTPSSGLRIEDRVALTTNIRVLGHLSPRITVGSLSLDQHDDFAFTVHNVGNALVTLSGSVRIDGRQLDLAPKNLYVIPGGDATLRAHWRKRPWFGQVSARAHVIGTLTDHAPVVADSARFHEWFIPWRDLSTIATFIAAFALIALATRSRRRSWWAKHREERELTRRVIAEHRASKGGKPSV